MDRRGKWQDEIKHHLMLPHEVLAAMFEHGDFEMLAGQSAATCLAAIRVMPEVAWR